MELDVDFCINTMELYTKNGLYRRDGILVVMAYHSFTRCRRTKSNMSFFFLFNSNVICFGIYLMHDGFMQSIDNQKNKPEIVEYQNY